MFLSLLLLIDISRAFILQTASLVGFFFVFFLFLRRPVHSAFNRRREVDGQLNGNEPIERRRRGNKQTTAEKRKKKVEGKQENRGLPHIKRRVTKGAVRRKISTAPCMRKNFSFFLYIFMYPFGFRQLIVVYTKPRALRLQSLGEMSRKKRKEKSQSPAFCIFP